LKVLNDSLSVNQLLGKESGGGKHGKTSVLKLLGLKSEKLICIRGLQAKGIKSKVSGNVGVTKKTRLRNRNILGLNPADGGTLLLGSTNGNGQKGPEDRGNLGQVGDGRSRDLGIEKERRSLNLLTNKETNNLVYSEWPKKKLSETWFLKDFVLERTNQKRSTYGKHGNTSVSQFGLTVSLESGLISLLGESKRVEKTNRRKGTRNGVNRKVEGGGLLGGSGWGKGSSRAEKSKEGSSELHC